jgi:5'(3')-deoxyribonucleotidase
MRQQKKAVIDIDNTLWHFCDVLYERLREINKAIPPPDDWVEWDFWENFCSKKEFLGAIDDIHLSQDDDRHVPYPEAKGFLKSLKEQDFYITVASHRTTDSTEQTRKWLLKHELIVDEIHLSYDKTVLIDATCYAVVDDAPHILENATEKGVIAAGLLFPWNRNFRNNGYKLCNNLDEILRHILNEIK